jgi:chromosome partitioning protein
MGELIASQRRIVSIANMKGGTGKTTTAVNLAAGLTLVDKEATVLVIDLDPQANLSVTFGIDIADLHVSISEILLEDDLDFEYAIFKKGRLHIVPSTMRLAIVQRQLQAITAGEFNLRDKLAKIARDYDYIIIDTPPQLSTLLDSALYASQEILIPIDVGYYSMLGIQELLTIVERIRKINPTITVTGVLITFAEQTVITREVIEHAKKEFGDRVFNTVIRKNVRLAEAPSAHQTIYEYEPDSIGATDYLNFVREFTNWRKPRNGN